jgi:hypothetical protein
LSLKDECQKLFSDYEEAFSTFQKKLSSVPPPPDYTMDDLEEEMFFSSFLVNR